MTKKKPAVTSPAAVDFTDPKWDSDPLYGVKAPDQVSQLAQEILFQSFRELGDEPSPPKARKLYREWLAKQTKASG
jgi:hypothetical protein